MDNNSNNNNNSNNISNNNNNIENINYEVETYSNSENNSMPQSNNSFYQNTTNYPQNIGNDNENPIIDNQNHNRNNIQKNNNPALGQRRMNHNSNSLTEGNNNKNQHDKQNKGINNNNNKPNNNQNNTPNKNDNPNNSANGNNNKNPLPGSVNNKGNSDKNKNDPNKNSVKPKQDKKKDFNPKKNLRDYTPGNMVRNAASRLGLGNKKEDDSNKSSGGQASNVIKGGLKNLWAMAPISVKITVASTAGVLAIIAIILLAILGGTTGVIVSSMCDSDSNGSTAYTGSADVKEFLCKIQAPVTNASMSSSIGERDCEFHGREWHSGVDFAVGEGTPVYAAEAGKVVLANREGCRGNNIVIEHNGNLHTRYLHLSELKVHEGDSVSKGQLIGKSGNTGSCTTGAHLHFEVISGSDYNYWVLTEISKMSEVYPSITNERFSNPESFKQNCGSTWQGDTAGESAGKSNGSTTYTSSSSTSSSFVSSSGTFAKYNLSETQLKGLAAIALREQGSPKGAAAEASLMANRFEMYGSSFGTGAEGLVKYVTTSGWFADSRGTYNSGTSNKEIIKAVRSVLVDGKRTLAGYVDEHDCWNCNSYNRCSNGMQGDICTLRNKSTVYTKMSDINNRSNYIQHETIVGNVYRSNYTFYSFPTENSDPFGYTATAKTKRATIGDVYYDFDTGKLINGSGSSSSDDQCCDTSSSSSASLSGGSSNLMDGLPPILTEASVNSILASQSSYNIPASITMAQVILESGVNGSALSRDCYNLFGIKGTGSAGTCNMATKEDYGNGLFDTRANFRKYKSYDEGIKDHADILLHDRYTKNNPRTPEEWANALQSGGYATDTGYADKLIEIIKTYNLYRYDNYSSSGSTCSIGGDGFTGKIWPFYQTDYPNVRYCGGTIANWGCAPTAMAIVVSSLLNQSIDPTKTADSKFCDAAGTSWSYFASAGKKYGLTVKQVSVNQSSEVLAALNSGKSLVIASMGAGTFTNGGHFIVLTSTDGEKVAVQDPSGTKNSKSWNFNDPIKKEAKQFWIISK